MACVAPERRVRDNAPCLSENSRGLCGIIFLADASGLVLLTRIAVVVWALRQTPCFDFMKYLAMILALAAVIPGAMAQPVGAVPFDLTKTPGTRQYTDQATGVSVTLPDGWMIREAYRWGTGHRENTVVLSPKRGRAAPRMYYQPYDAKALKDMASGDLHGMLREQAQLKEASRRRIVLDYRNVPGSFVFFEVMGRPAMAYLATFLGREEDSAEHFIRVLGPKGYVMFFTSGPLEDVEALIPQLMQMAGSAMGPQ